VVLSSVFYRGDLLLHILDRRDRLRNRNPSVGSYGSQGNCPSRAATILHLGSTSDVPFL